MLNRFLIIFLFNFLIPCLCSDYIYANVSRQLKVPQDYNTIQKAVNQATPEDSIIVDKVMYREKIISSRPVQIEGQDAEQTIIEGEIAIEPNSFRNNNAVLKNLSLISGGIIATECSEIIIENCIIKKSASYGIALSNNKKTFIKNCQVSDCNRAGIFLDGVNVPLVIGNSSKNNDEGIVIQNAKQCSLNDNALTGNKLNGIKVSMAENASIKGSICIENGKSGININESNCIIENNRILKNNEGSGIYINNSGECLLNNNVIEEDESHGIHIENSGKVSLIKNICNNNSKIGIYINNCGTLNDISLIDNISKNNKRSGIQLENVKKTMIKNCTTGDNNQAGIYIYKIENASIAENHSYSNNGMGIIAYFVKYCDVNNNTANENKAEGIFASECNDAVISGNTSIKNNRSGIAITNSAFLVEKNYCEKNKHCGIYLYGRKDNNDIDFNSAMVNTPWPQAKNRLINNICLNNILMGIDSEYWKTPLTIEKNRCEDNNDCGIKITRAKSYIYLSDNICKNNSYGIDGLDSGIFSIKENKCFDSRKGGIYLDRCKYGIISGNTAMRNKYSGIISFETECLIENNSSIDNRQCGVYLLGKEDDNDIKPNAGMQKIDRDKTLTKIINNSVIDNKSNGIEIYFWKKTAVIEKNLCQYNSTDGIQLNHTSALISDNIIKYNAVEGLNIYKTTYVSAEKNIINNNGDGILVGKIIDGNVNITENTICGNYKLGLEIWDGGSATVKSNTIEKNAYEGIAVYGNPNNMTMAAITNNILKDNYPSGIIITKGAAGKIRDNEISGHTWSGIAIRDKGTEPILSGNKCFNNQCWGIVCWDDAMPMISSDNIIQNNGISGIKYKEKLVIIDENYDESSNF
jgi:parallel beta-helix repeat protein